MHSSHIEMVFSGHKCQKAELVLRPAEATMTDIQTAVGASLFREGGRFCPHQSNWDRRRGNEHLGGRSLFTAGRERTQVRGKQDAGERHQDHKEDGKPYAKEAESNKLTFCSLLFDFD